MITRNLSERRHPGVVKLLRWWFACVLTAGAAEPHPPAALAAGLTAGVIGRLTAGAARGMEPSLYGLMLTLTWKSVTEPEAEAFAASVTEPR